MVPYRLVGRASERIDDILLESAKRWGVDAADRYHRLLLAAMDEVGKNPDLLGSRTIPQVAGLRTYQLVLARRKVEREHRVGQPRHLLIYHVAADGIVEILSVVHDRMHVPRVALRARREAIPTPTQPAPQSAS